MNLDLEGKTAIITGSSRGIGKSIAQLLHSEGCNIVLNGRNVNSLKKVSKTLPNSNYFACDVTNSNDCKELIKFTVDTWGKLDLLICNVGGGKSVSPGKENFLEWEKMFQTNFFSATNMIESSIPHLVKSKGTVVCISSIAGIEYIGASNTYSTAKSALNSYVKGISRYLGKNNIRINVVAPGNIFFKGSVWDKKLKDNPKSVNKMLREHVSLKRLGIPTDIANIVSFLCSSKCSFVTGQVFVVDGGQIKS